MTNSTDMKGWGEPASDLRLREYNTPVTFGEAMQALGALGSAQNRKVYARRGAGPEMLGVSYANQDKLAKNSGVDHALAR